eukprot:TRINITY_DN33283_c0_g1_i2.p1 TRINITY_DN33283_c0_g1~~TRINITY_DN33283_c0_g1_i2.p1  ORF type:complete len:435 (+),score=73.27 TRINITY_DN33283_c0_g1_i2:221-1525(+)
MTLTAVAGILIASHDVTGPLGVLIGLSLLGLTCSRSTGGPLFVAPSETRMQRRTLIYDLACQVGCLWTSLVVGLLSHDTVKEYWYCRFVVICSPLVVTYVAWLLLPEAAYFSGTRMEQEQQRLLSDKYSFEEDASGGPEEVPAPQQIPSTLQKGREFDQAGEAEADSSSEADMSLPGALQGEKSPSAPGADQTGTGCYAQEDLASEVGKPSTAQSTPELTTRWTASPWKHDGFVLIACIWFLNWWSFNFYTYNIFPIFMTNSGPSLTTVGVMYTIEGLCANCVLVLLMRFLKTYIFEKFFIGAVILTILPIPVVVWHESCHWFLYLLTILSMDIVCACNNLLLGPVLLRCVPWNLMSDFYAQASAAGAILSAISFVQYSLHEVLGWPLTILLGHGGILVVFACVMTFKKQTLVKTYKVSTVSVKNLRSGAAHPA